MSWQYAKEFQKLNTDMGINMYPSPVSFNTVSGSDFAIKHDEQLELGCSKQRSLSYMIAKYVEAGEKKFTVSSSGNAALVAAFAILGHPECTLRIFLSNQISDHKLEQFTIKLKIPIRVKDLRKGGKFGNVEFVLTDNPKQKAFQLGNDGWRNLRGSQDDLALIGFRTIAYELMDINDRWDAVFVPASSGTTALGIYQGFREAGLNPAMHVVQTTKVNTLVNKLHPEIGVVEEPDHPSESIVDVVGHRRKQIEEMIQQSGGEGWIISKDEVEKAKRALEALGINASYDSALTFAAFRKATTNRRFQNPVMIFTG